MTFWAIHRELLDHPGDYWGAIHGWTSELRAVRFQRREDAAAVIAQLWGGRHRSREYEALIPVEVTL